MKQLSQRVWQTLAISCLTVVFLLGCSAKKTTEEEYAGQSAQQIYDRAQAEMKEGSYSSAVKDFEALQSLYPFGEHAEQAALDIIYTYYASSDYISTVQAAENYMHVYPRSTYVDYAYYMRAVATMYQDRSIPQRYVKVNLAERDLKSARESFRYFGELLQFYPSTIYYDDARQRMIYLRNLFAQHEYETAEFYYQRKAYLAAAERAQNVLMHFQHSPYLSKALILMLKSYSQLELPGLSQPAWEILETNYPEVAQNYLEEQTKAEAPPAQVPLPPAVE